MNDQAACSYVVGIPKIVNKQSKDFEREPSFFLSFGVKTNIANTMEHFSSDDEAKNAAIIHHRKQLESGYLAKDEVDSIYAIGRIENPNATSGRINWKFFAAKQTDKKDITSIVLDHIS